MPNVFGKHLKVVREKRGLKASFVAQKIRVSEATLSKIETGIRKLSAERMVGIIRAMELDGLELAELMNQGWQEWREKKKQANKDESLLYKKHLVRQKRGAEKR